MRAPGSTGRGLYVPPWSRPSPAPPRRAVTAKIGSYLEAGDRDRRALDTALRAMRRLPAERRTLERCARSGDSPLIVDRGERCGAREDGRGHRAGAALFRGRNQRTSAPRVVPGDLDHDEGGGSAAPRRHERRSPHALIHIGTVLGRVAPGAVPPDARDAADGSRCASTPGTVKRSHRHALVPVRSAGVIETWGVSPE